MTGSQLTRITPILARLARLFSDYDMTLAEINPLGELEDGSFVALDAHMEMENEARPRQKALLAGAGSATRRPARRARRPRSRSRARQVDAMDHRGVAGNVTEFDGNLGLVIGAGGGSLTLFDAVRKYGGKPANYCEIGGNPSVAKAAGLAKLVLSKPGVDKIAVMMSIVSNTRVDIVARGVDQGMPRARLRPGREDRDLPDPRRLGGRGLQDPREVRRRVLRPLGVDARGGAPRRREDPGGAVAGMSILIDEDTTFIVQGITGREAVNLTRECLDYGKGAKVVGGVTPGPQGPRRARRAGVRHGRAGRRAPRSARSKGSVVTVPPAFTKDAVFEALEHGIELIVIVTERIPRRDVAQMVELADARGARASSARTASA